MSQNQGNIPSLAGRQGLFQKILDRLEKVERAIKGGGATTFTIATQPDATAVTPGTQVFVSDAPTGTKMQYAADGVWNPMG